MESAGVRRFDRDAARPAPPERSEGRGSAATGARGRDGERVASGPPSRDRVDSIPPRGHMPTGRGEEQTWGPISREGGR